MAAPSRPQMSGAREQAEARFAALVAPGPAPASPTEVAAAVDAEKAARLKALRLARDGDATGKRRAG